MSQQSQSSVAHSEVASPHNGQNGTVVAEWKEGNTRVTLWANENDGRVRTSVTLTKWFSGRDGELKQSSMTLFPTELLLMNRLMAQAERAVIERSASRAADGHATPI